MFAKLISIVFGGECKLKQCIRCHECYDDEYMHFCVLR